MQKILLRTSVFIRCFRARSSNCWVYTLVCWSVVHVSESCFSVLPGTGPVHADPTTHHLPRSLAATTVISYMWPTLIIHKDRDTIMLPSSAYVCIFCLNQWTHFTNHYHPRAPLPRSDTGLILPYVLVLLTASTRGRCSPQPVPLLRHAPSPSFLPTIGPGFLWAKPLPI